MEKEFIGIKQVRKFLSITKMVREMVMVNTSLIMVGFLQEIL